MIAACAERFGRLDGLVNAAGLSRAGRSTTRASSSGTGSSPSMCARRSCSPRRRRGSCAATARRQRRQRHHDGQPRRRAGAHGLLGLQGRAGHAARATLGYALQPDRIRVNGLNIGWTATEGEHGVQTGTGQADDWLAEADASRPLGRLLRPADIAPMVTYLLSDAARDGHRVGHRLRPDRARAVRRARRARSGGGGMRVFVTGASGFVGSNLRPRLRRAPRRRGDRSRRTTRSMSPTPVRSAGRPPRRARTRSCTRRSGTTRGLLDGDRRRAWAAYVGATRNLVDAANAAGAHVVLVSTDWVFDGTQGAGRRGRAAEPDQRLRVPQGGVGAGRHRARRARRRRAHRRRAGRPPGAAGRAARAGRGLRLLRRLARRRAARRRALHRLGRARASTRSPRRRSPPTPPS